MSCNGVILTWTKSTKLLCSWNRNGAPPNKTPTHIANMRIKSVLRNRNTQADPRGNQSIILFRRFHSQVQQKYQLAIFTSELKLVQSFLQEENSKLTDSICQVRVHSEDYVSQVFKQGQICARVINESQRHKCNRCLLVLVYDRESCGRCVTKIEDIQKHVRINSGLKTIIVWVSSRNLKDQTRRHDIGDYSDGEVESMNLSSSSKDCIHVHKYTQEPLTEPTSLTKSTFCQRFWAFARGCLINKNSQCCSESSSDDGSNIFESRNLRPGIHDFNHNQGE